MRWNDSVELHSIENKDFRKRSIWNNHRPYARIEGNDWLTKVLHENHIVLRDLKADNIIKKDGIYKIANFHFAERL